MYNNTMIKPIIILIALTLASNTQFIAPLLSEQIGGKIFHENELYMIYVCDQPDPKMEDVFNQYCEEDGRLCAILNPEVQQFRDFKAFIGHNADQFFTIIDAQRRKKYVLPIVQGMTSKDLFIFQSKFEQGLLSPFYSSEQPDPKPYEKCQKVVGRSLDKFLKNEAEIKVLFLYTQHSACQVCGQMLRGFADIAQRLYDKEIVIFGYYDIFKNDNPRIKDEILPYFLIYTKQKEQPYGLEGDKFHELEQTVIQIALKDTDIDLDRFRREHTFHVGNEKPERQFEHNYKLEADKEKEEDLNQL